MIPEGTFYAGRHLYAWCPDCGKAVRLTGFLARWHLCLTPEELAHKHEAEQRVRNQEAAARQRGVEFMRSLGL